jgi:predicted Fe-Mo cluster-binding NifX family protein
VIAGGMGQRAQQLFSAKGVNVITGAMGECPREVVENYLKGTLVTGGTPVTINSLPDYMYI